MKPWIWKLTSIVLIIILLVIFFYRNIQTTSEVDFLVTAVTIKTWKLIVISFFLGGAVFCGIASMFKFKSGGKKPVDNQPETSPGSNGSS